MRLIYTVIIATLLCIPAFADSSPANGDEELIGKTVSYGVKKLKLRFGHVFVIDEPPGVPQGIKGKTPSGDEVSLFVRSGSARFSTRMDWTLRDFSKQQIIGVSRLKGNKRLNTGFVLWY